MVSSIEHTNGSRGEDLCLTCGLCCDGTIFADVKLQASDTPARLLALGLPLRRAKVKLTKAAPALALPRPAAVHSCKFDQPCAAFRGQQCRIYEDRPNHCREFECLLLKGVKAGKMEKKAALGIIQKARGRSDRVSRMLRRLGDVDEALPLHKRFRRTSKRLEAVGLDDVTAATFAELSLAVHALNLLLSQSFYPGDQ
jgi:Fe-S-cluster containining protein